MSNRSRAREAAVEAAKHFLLLFGAVLASAALLVKCAPAGEIDVRPLTRDEHLVRMILQEANTEPLIAKVAVAGVALNRVADDRWPDTEREVVRQPWQFTGMMRKLNPGYTAAQIVEARTAAWLARRGRRPCGGALWYHRSDIFPTWAEELTPRCSIGEHVFYTD